jgi:hypothetical protein
VNFNKLPQIEKIQKTPDDISRDVINRVNELNLEDTLNNRILILLAWHPKLKDKNYILDELSKATDKLELTSRLEYFESEVEKQLVF